jgi:hypothetical protein
MILCPVRGRDQGNLDENISQGQGRGTGTGTGERSADGLDQFRVVRTRVRVSHIGGKNIVKIKTEKGKGPRARSAGKRNDVKKRRRKKRYAHTQLAYMMIFNINTEKEGERKCTTLGKVWNNIRCGVRQFIYLFSSNVPNLFQLAFLPKTKSSILGWSRNGRSILKRFLKSSKKGSSLALLKITIQVLQHFHLLLRFIQLLLFSYIIPREVLQHGSLRETYVSTQTRRILATCK